MKERDSRVRKLRIRTFSVLPLSEESGLIEWVPDTQAFRTLVARCHASENVAYTFQHARELYGQVSSFHTNAGL